MNTAGKLILIVFAAGICALVQGLIVGKADFSVTMDEWGVEIADLGKWDTVILVDARPVTSYGEGHYPGAVHINEDDWDAGFGELLEQWNPGAVIVVYCDDSLCANSREVAGRLRSELGYEKVYWLAGGWTELKEVR